MTSPPLRERHDMSSAGGIALAAQHVSNGRHGTRERDCSGAVDRAISPASDISMCERMPFARGATSNTDLKTPSADEAFAGVLRTKGKARDKRAFVFRTS